MLKPKPDQVAAWIEQNFDFKTRTGKNGKEYVIQSPFRVDDKYKFNINLERATCHDWRGDEWAIGGSKSFIRFVQLYRNCSYTSAAKEIFGSGTTLDAIYKRIRREKSQEQAEQEEIRKYLCGQSLRICG